MIIPRSITSIISKDQDHTNIMKQLKGHHDPTVT